jgi:hypothetical protein
MGRNAKAIEEAERSLKIRENTLDQPNGPYVRYQAARIPVQAGAFDRALDIIEPLMTGMYSKLTPSWLKLEPTFRPLRSSPRLEQLIANVKLARCFAPRLRCRYHAPKTCEREIFARCRESRPSTVEAGCDIGIRIECATTNDVQASVGRIAGLGVRR